MAGDSGADSFTEEKPGFGPRAEASETAVLKVIVGYTTVGSASLCQSPCSKQ